jgi:hypothetical protein
MLEILVENYKEFGQIFLYTTVLLITLLVVFYSKAKAHVVENWAYYRSNPILLPIAGYIYTPPGYTPGEYTKANIINVVWSLVSKTLSTLMIPIYPIIQLFLKLMKQFSESLNSIRQQMAVMRNFLFKIFENINVRLQTSIAAITFYMLKLRESLKRSFGLMNLMVSSLEHSYIFMQTLVRSPLVKFGEMAEEGGLWMSRFALPIGMGDRVWRDQFVSMCFYPDTPIAISNGLYKQIKELVIGDVLAGGATILATIRTKVSGNMYQLGSDIVSGNHRVMGKHGWIRVKDHPNAEFIVYPETEVYCLVTSDGTISTKEHLYRDYMDSHSLEVNREVQRMVGYYLNNKDISTDLVCNDLLAGIDPKIRVNPLSIIGRIIITPGQLSIYNIDGYLVSGLTLLKWCGKWIRAYTHPKAIYIGKNEVPYYHYVTHSGNILLDSVSDRELLIRDFCEIDNIYVEEEINLYVDRQDV